MWLLQTGVKSMQGPDGKRISNEWRAIHVIALVFILLTAIGMAGPSAAQDVSAPLLLGERPSENGEPTQVTLGLFIMDIDEIDDVNQRFSVDMFIVARWRDPRLMLPEGERTGNKRFMTLDEVWTPRILFLNNRGLKSQLREGVEIDDLGNVKFQNRLSGELAANLEFREFPFDVQHLAIDLVSYEYKTDEMQFSTDSVVVTQSKKFSIEGWDLELLQPDVGSFVVPTDSADLPRLTYVIEASRDSQYYILTMLVPMSLIIFMAWTVFWLHPSTVPPRISISTASIFSLIALGVSIRLSLPKISYLTKADIFVVGCTLLVFLALAITVLGSRWANSDRMEWALRSNAIARWIYMLMFVVIGLIAIYH
jgi:hypothetical protein